MAMSKIRNPKSEGRSRSRGTEIRNPNDHGRRPGVLRVSDFGLLSDFGFRTSDFASPPRPPEAADWLRSFGFQGGYQYPATHPPLQPQDGTTRKNLKSEI